MDHPDCNKLFYNIREKYSKEVHHPLCPGAGWYQSVSGMCPEAG